jgi:hypothetical protein
MLVRFTNEIDIDGLRSRESCCFAESAFGGLWTQREAGQRSNIDADSNYDERCRDVVLNDGEKMERLLVLNL